MDSKVGTKEPHSSKFGDDCTVDESTLSLQFVFLLVELDDAEVDGIQISGRKYIVAGRIPREQKNMR
jgi:hypothetical protein